MISSVSNVKRAQKESVLFREISQLFLQASLDDPALRNFSITRVKLSPDKGTCTIYFYSPQGEENFRKVQHILLDYKPSLRKALASGLQARYTPQLVFAFDAQFEKQQRIEQLIEQVKTED